MNSFHSSRVRQVLAVTCSLGLLAGIAVGDEIKWRSAPAASETTTTTTTMEHQLHTLAARADASRMTIQFVNTPTTATRAALEAAGLKLLAPLGDRAYFASLDAARLDARTIERLGIVEQVNTIDPVVKLHPLFNRGDEVSWANVTEGDSDPLIGTYVLFHSDVDLEVKGLPLIESYGATVRDVLESINGAVVEMPYSLVYTLAQEDSIQWVEPALPKFSTLNDSNRAATQVDEVNAFPYQLDGSGVTVLVYDGGYARASHDDFNGRLTVHDNSGMSSHATHVAGTVGGNGAASGGTHRGMAPGVNIVSFGFEYSGGGTFLYSNPGDIEADYASALALGADISNNSIGSNTEPNGFDCNIQGDYGVTASLIDAIVRGSLGEPFRIVWAGGNERSGSDCDIEGYGDYYSTAPPGAAKNKITVGAINSNDDSMTGFSSWGPVDDGRIKPDITAPGCQSNGDFGVTSPTAGSDTSYSSYCGTSMASPTVCGALALLLEDFRNQYPGQDDPRNSTLKALLISSVEDLGNPGPDYVFGYGALRIRDTIDLMRTGNFFEEEIDQGEINEFRVTVDPGTPELTISIAWDDAPAVPNVADALVNDLDLVVTSPSGTRFYPWTLDPFNPSANAVRTQEDHRNNSEQVFVENPEAGNWTVQIIAHDVPSGPQPFSIVATELIAPSGVNVNFPSGVPTVLDAGVGVSFPVSISSVTETVIPNTATLHVRYDGGDFIELPLVDLGAGDYEATLPPGVCGAIPEFFVSVEGDQSGVVTRPLDAPSNAFFAYIGVEGTFYENFVEASTGWTAGVTGDTATTGQWEHGDPEGSAAQPEDDHTPAGTNCFVTGRVNGGSLGANDIDGGDTTLLSPIFDATGIDDVRLSYNRWFSNDTGATPNTDVFTIDISNNGGASWQTLEIVGPSGAGTSGGWFLADFDLAAEITPTDQMRLRFIAEDAGDGSLVEAAIDDLSVYGRQCLDTLADCNGNGILDSDDIAAGRADDVNGNGIPDECDGPICVGDFDANGSVDSSDLNVLLAAYGCPSGAPCGVADINGDDFVDSADLNLLLSAWGACP